jgi:hypothetical protein
MVAQMGQAIPTPSSLPRTSCLVAASRQAAMLCKQTSPLGATQEHAFHYKMYSVHEGKVILKPEDLSHRNTASNRATATFNFLHALTAPLRAALFAKRMIVIPDTQHCRNMTATCQCRADHFRAERNRWNLRLFHEARI